MKKTTIAAIATAQGQGGIGVIRVSGEESIDIVDKIFKSVSGKKVSDLKGYRASYGKIYSGKDIVDEVVVLVFRAPHSYTGENIVEISCHGGLYVTRQILNLVLKNGASIAEPGEFTKRAFLNGKIDLTEAEAVMGIIGAKGKSAAKAAIAAREGALSKKINLIKDELVNLAAFLSVWADYPEDDIPEVERESILKRLNVVCKSLEKMISQYDSGKALIDGIETVIIGSPNVGKSTLMNLLSGTQRCIVTDIPGTTRDIVEETVILGDITLRLSDTAGIRDTKDPVELIGVNLAKSRVKSAQLVLVVFDGAKELSEADKNLICSLDCANTVAIINKSDLPMKIDRSLIEKKINNIVYLSAKTGNGLESLGEVITKVVGLADIEPSNGILATQRQYFAAISALEGVKEAINAVTGGFTLDAVTVSVEYAVDELLNLTGEKATKVVVDEVFSKFCVGK